MRLLARITLVVAVAATGVAPTFAQPAFDQLRIIAPAAPGGGWDQTARAMQQVLQRAGIVRTPIVENIPGAPGTIGLARFIGAERGNGDTLMVSGLIMLGGIVTHQSPVTLTDVVPIARIVYQVGRPAMFDGNMFLPETGTPINRIDRSNTRLAV